MIIRIGVFSFALFDFHFIGFCKLQRFLNILGLDGCLNRLNFRFLDVMNFLHSWLDRCLCYFLGRWRVVIALDRGWRFPS